MTVKTRTNLKDKLRKKALEDALDAPIESEGWINLYFSVAGHCGSGYRVHPSEESARNSAEKDIKGADSGYIKNDHWNFVLTTKDSHKSPEYGECYKYSHTIQMPVSSND